MRIFISKRLPFGLRAGVLFDPVRMQQSQRAVGNGGTLSSLGGGVSGVYVITGAHNMCKIGISTDPELRLAALQTGSHVLLKLHYVLAVKSIDPRQIEMLTHKMLDKYRCAGEWFDCTPQMAEDAVNDAAAHYGIKTFQTRSDTVFGDLQPRRRMSDGKQFLLLMAAMLIAIFAAVYLGLIPPMKY